MYLLGKPLIRLGSASDDSEAGLVWPNGHRFVPKPNTINSFIINTFIIIQLLIYKNDVSNYMIFCSLLILHSKFNLDLDLTPFCMIGESWKSCIDSELKVNELK